MISLNFAIFLNFFFFFFFLFFFSLWNYFHFIFHFHQSDFHQRKKKEKKSHKRKEKKRKRKEKRSRKEPVVVNCLIAGRSRGVILLLSFPFFFVNKHAGAPQTFHQRQQPLTQHLKIFKVNEVEVLVVVPSPFFCYESLRVPCSVQNSSAIMSTYRCCTFFRARVTCFPSFSTVSST